jgi:hypothetical protein
VSPEKVILLLGRRDEPTDGVVGYCEMLREAGTQRGLSFELVSIPRAEWWWGTARTQLGAVAQLWTSH